MTAVEERASNANLHNYYISTRDFSRLVDICTQPAIDVRQVTIKSRNDNLMDNVFAC